MAKAGYTEAGRAFVLRFLLPSVISLCGCGATPYLAESPTAALPIEAKRPIARATEEAGAAEPSKEHWMLKTVRGFLTSRRQLSGSIMVVPTIGNGKKLSVTAEQIWDLVGYGASVEEYTAHTIDGKHSKGAIRITKLNYFPLNRRPSEQRYTATRGRPYLTQKDRVRLDRLLSGNHFRQGDMLALVKTGKELVTNLNSNSAGYRKREEEKLLSDYDFVLMPAIESYVGERGIVESYWTKEEGEDRTIYLIFRTLPGKDGLDTRDLLERGDGPPPSKHKQRLRPPNK